MRPQDNTRQAGFSLLELLVTLTLMTILMTIGTPWLINQIGRQKLLGTGRELATAMRSARLEAIKLNAPTVFEVDVDSSKRTLISYSDDDDDGVLDLGERVIHRGTVRAGVYFRSPTGTAVNDLIDGLEKKGTVALVRFNSDGSVDATGGIRYADNRGNYMEVRIEPLSVARVKVRKWNGKGWYGKDDSPDGWVWQ
ncbi:MAG: GspH/FimT family protein [Acidimicrobiia bacterium]|nr:GspH/FimT family protein [Acidimicrobiia bacterium]